ncbi:hypothetical protein ACOME3_007075 [Neoechinorhynchus agilis]
MSTVKDILAKAILLEIETLKSEQLVEVKKCKGKKANGLQKSTSGVATKKNTVFLDAISIPNSNEDSLEAIGVQKSMNISKITKDLVPPLEDIQPVVLNDSKITVKEYDIVTGIKGNAIKSERNSAEVTTNKATVEQKIEETSERVETRAK